jgi:hypothetical protein
MSEEFWSDILLKEDFNEFVRKKYEIAYGNIMGDIMGENDVLESEKA